MRLANTRKRGITQHAGAWAAERRIRHYRQTVPRAPWQQVTFNAAVADVVNDLIGRAAIAVWNSKQIFHLADRKVGYAPGTNFSRRTETFEPRDKRGKLGARHRPVQLVEIEIIRTEARKARLAGARDAITFHLVGLHLRDQE